MSTSDVPHNASLTAAAPPAFTGVELSDGAGGGAVRHVVFDEAVIAEHDKDRGTRRKISEPKTPYRAPMSAGSVGSAASDDSMAGPVSADRLAAALGGGWDESDGDEGSCVAEAFAFAKIFFSFCWRANTRLFPSRTL